MGEHTAVVSAMVQKRLEALVEELVRTGEGIGARNSNLAGRSLFDS